MNIIFGLLIIAIIITIFILEKARSKQVDDLIEQMTIKNTIYINEFTKMNKKLEGFKSKINSFHITIDAINNRSISLKENVAKLEKINKDTVANDLRYYLLESLKNHIDKTYKSITKDTSNISTKLDNHLNAYARFIHHYNNLYNEFDSLSGKNNKNNTKKGGKSV